ncbi:hypothetical protein, partial [Cypionkella sp.]|uniref:hypothetical protein n=1 Tax=Cypionkella sp. TaxID=2811411 RepID=UPI0037531528
HSFGGHGQALIKVDAGIEPNRSLILNPHAKIVKLLGCCTGMIDCSYPRLKPDSVRTCQP